MARDIAAQAGQLFVGVDVGGTKIQVSVVDGSGLIVDRYRTPTPRGVSQDDVIDAIEAAIRDTLAEEGLSPKDIAAIGVAVAGVVDPKRGVVIVTPNMNLTGADISPRLEDALGVPVVLGNDTNLGTLGERWLGCGRNARSVFGILVGTGIGGGFVRGSKLLRGYRNSAAEIGHMIIQPGGPECGCGSEGCFESLASRTAMERDIRQAVAEGRKTVLSDLLQGELGVIRSGKLRDALAEGDKLVMDVLRRASKTIGLACVNIRHLMDPEVIFLGGGVVEACASFMLPIVQEVVDGDPLAGSRPARPVMVAALGDDAVVLGAVALAKIHVGRNPFRKRFRVKPIYPKCSTGEPGRITFGKKTLSRDARVKVNGKAKKRKKKYMADTPHHVSLDEIQKLVDGGPEELHIAAPDATDIHLPHEAKVYLDHRGIRLVLSPLSEVAETFNKSKKRRAALVMIT